jgi:hypothetical protein
MRDLPRTRSLADGKLSHKPTQDAIWTAEVASALGRRRTVLAALATYFALELLLVALLHGPSVLFIALQIAVMALLVAGAVRPDHLAPWTLPLAIAAHSAAFSARTCVLPLS